MKKQRLYLVSLCAVTAILASSCDSDDNSKYSCDAAVQCAEKLGGDVSYWRCDIEYGKCVAQLPEHCFNGVIDSGKETGKDCGGVCVSESKLVDGSAFKCDNSVTCTVDADCKSGACINKVCSQKSCETSNDCNGGNCVEENGKRICVSCNDGAKNQDETDVDCGGSCGTKCAAGKACKINSDCELGLCENSVCSNVEIKTAEVDSLLINEIMVAEDTTANSKAFFTYNNNGGECKFVEIVNVSDNAMAVDDCTLFLNRTDAEKASSTPLSGTLVSKGMLVAYYCDPKKVEGLDLPAGTLSVTLGNTGNITMTGTYDAFIKCGENEGTHIALDKATKGISMNRSVDGQTDANMILHTDVASNMAKVVASPGYCANGGIYSEGCANKCGNGQKDGTETDTDCGGGCAKCALGKACNAASDCDSGNCAENICVVKNCEDDKDCNGGKCNKDSGVCYTPESCEDNTKNQEETDIDCGGNCAPCAVGKSCSQPKDCETGECTGGVCTGVVPETADPGKLVVNEIFDSGSKSPEFSLNGKVPACEFIEIANPTAEDMNLSGIKLVLLGFNGNNVEQKPLEIPLSGVLKSKNLLVVHNCDNLPLPDDAVPSKQTSFKLTGTWTYKIELVSETQSSTQLEDFAIASVTDSSYVRDPEFNSTSEMKKTIEVAGNMAFATPGYCTNGGRYSENCKVSCGNGNESCGGICPKCENGKSCTKPEDCASGECTGNFCTGTEIAYAKKNDIVINEVMGAPDGNKMFAIQTSTKQNEYIEIVNLKDEKLSLDNISIELAKDGTDTSSTVTKSVKLSGQIPAKGVVVVSEAEIPMPDDGINIVSLKASITNANPYVIWLADGTDKFSLVKFAKSTSGVSFNRAPDLGSDETLVLHKELNSNLNSPGYCANGKKFSEGCEGGGNNNDQPQETGGLKACTANGNECGADEACTAYYENETGVCLTKCPNGNECNADTGEICKYDLCVSCKDGAKDGDESDVDCGGADCSKCAAGKACIEDDDCVSGKCTNSVCE